MLKHTPFTGGCVCGAVRYKCTARAITMFNCHCRTCQMVSGGPYVPVILVPSKAFKITTGKLQYHFTTKIDEGLHRRGFCADCGSRLTGGERDQPTKWVGITASSLDDPSRYLAEYDIFTSHAQGWDLMDSKIPKHEKYPPR